MADRILPPADDPNRPPEYAREMYPFDFERVMQNVNEEKAVRAIQAANPTWQEKVINSLPPALQSAYHTGVALYGMNQMFSPFALIDQVAKLAGPSDESGLNRLYPGERHYRLYQGPPGFRNPMMGE